MSEFGRLLAEQDRAPAPRRTVRVPTEAEIKNMSTADLRALLARGFEAANLAIAGTKGRSKTAAENHRAEALWVLRRASMEAIQALERSVEAAAIPSGYWWDDHYDAPDEELTGPIRPL